MDSNFTLKDIDKVAALFLEEIKNHRIIAFHGEMGAGKTSFINAVCKQLQVTDISSSPTFSIINQYKTQHGAFVYHMDLYRLKDEEEAILAGVEDCFLSGDYCFVEWPENALGLFTEDALHCYIRSTGNNERNLQIKL